MCEWMEMELSCHVAYTHTNTLDIHMHTSSFTLITLLLICWHQLLFIVVVEIAEHLWPCYERNAALLHAQQTYIYILPTYLHTSVPDTCTALHRRICFPHTLFFLYIFIRARVCLCVCVFPLFLSCGISIDKWRNELQQVHAQFANISP